MISQTPESPAREVERYAAEIEQLPGRRRACRRRRVDVAQALAVRRAVSTSRRSTTARQHLVRDIRALQPPGPTLRGRPDGRASSTSQDSARDAAAATRWRSSSASTFIILFLMTGSVVLPIKR